VFLELEQFWNADGCILYIIRCKLVLAVLFFEFFNQFFKQECRSVYT
jgi:hypothetical protein